MTSSLSREVKNLLKLSSISAVSSIYFGGGKYIVMKGAHNPRPHTSHSWLLEQYLQILLAVANFKLNTSIDHLNRWLMLNLDESRFLLEGT